MMAIPSIVFGAVGTAGQRCTTTRRLIIHESIYEKVKASLIKAYGSLRIGDPLDDNNHLGPLIDKSAVADFLEALERVKKEGGKVISAGGTLVIHFHRQHERGRNLPVALGIGLRY